MASIAAKSCNISSSKEKVTRFKKKPVAYRTPLSDSAVLVPLQPECFSGQSFSSKEMGTVKRDIGVGSNVNAEAVEEKVSKFKKKPVAYRTPLSDSAVLVPLQPECFSGQSFSRQEMGTVKRDSGVGSNVSNVNAECNDAEIKEKVSRYKKKPIAYRTPLSDSAVLVPLQPECFSGDSFSREEMCAVKRDSGVGSNVNAEAVEEKVSKFKKKPSAYRTPLSDSAVLVPVQHECSSDMFSGDSFKCQEMDTVKHDIGVGSSVNAEAVEEKVGKFKRKPSAYRTPLSDSAVLVPLQEECLSDMIDTVKHDSGVESNVNAECNDSETAEEKVSRGKRKPIAYRTPLSDSAVLVPLQHKCLSDMFPGESFSRDTVKLDSGVESNVNTDCNDVEVETVEEKESGYKRKPSAYRTPIIDPAKLAFSLQVQHECLSDHGVSFSSQEMDTVKRDSGIGSNVNAECNDAEKVEEKVSRYKRKPIAYRTPLSDSAMLVPVQHECLSDMFPGESFSRDTVKLDSGVGSDVNAECNDADWSDLRETELEEVVLANLDTMFRSAIKRILSYGYSEEVAMKGVLRSGHCCGSKDVVSNIVDNSLVFLNNGKEVEPLRGHNFENLEEMEKYILAELVCVVREVRPFFSTGDAMWCLLISDMNVSQACAMDGESSSGLVSNKGSNGCSPNSVDETQPKKEAAPVMDSVPKAEVPDLRQKASFVLDGFVSQKGKKGTAYRTMTRSFMLEDKVVGSRKITSKAEKGYRSHGIKGSSRTVKLGNIGGFILDKKVKYVLETTSISLKNASLKINESRGTINSNDLISASVSNTKIANKNNSTLPKTNIKPMSALSVAETELSLSLPSKTNKKPIPDVPNAGFSAMPDDKSFEQCISQDKKDEATLKLVTRVCELQNQMEEWTEWANQKVMQVARRLGKDKTELKTLKQEKEELERLKNEKLTLEKSTMKKLTEMEKALSKASSHLGEANATVCKLNVENARLRLEMEDAKLQAAESAVSCEEISEREKKTQIQSWEKQKTLFQKELIAEKRKLAQLKENLEQAKEQRDLLEAKWKHEEKAKQELVNQAIMYRTQRQEGEVLEKSREELIRLKADKNLQRYKDDIEKLEKEFSLLKVKSHCSKTDALETNGGVKRERECVMCLSEEMSVVFLPCAHQVVCTKCNELHKKQGMKDCPSCRGPIQRRICVRYARS